MVKERQFHLVCQPKASTNGAIPSIAVERSVVGDGDGFTVWAQVKDYSQVSMNILFSMQKHNDHLKHKRYSLASVVKRSSGVMVIGF
ncbi:hypothetical protein L1987_34342 [Smallanthus sonchifolius]|uniref:Uncharacterized protein n=1 Tax=Smallanthus sonchifolius TaxID=185202 RepID=A0ACB9HUR3_9ASTR|nr:hypothetical protein L1987_34342 [Smallanthus sonchifolius]